MKSIFTLLICLLTVLPLQSQFYNNRGRFEFARPYERTYRPKQKIQIRYDDAIHYTKPFNIHVDPGGLKDYSSSLVMNSYPTEEVENTDCYCHYESDFWKYEEALEEQLAHERKKWLENQEKILKEQIEERFDKKYSSFKIAQQEFFKEFAGYEDQPWHIKRFKEDVDKKSATSRGERDHLQSNHVVIHKAFENIINIHRGLNPKHELGDLRFPNGRRLDDRDYLSHLYNLMNYYHLGFYTFYQEAVSKNNEYHNYRALHHGAYIAENNDEMALHIANAYIKDYNSRDLGERVDVMTRYLINHALGFNKVPYKISEGFFRGVPYNYYTVKKYAEKHKPKSKSVMPSMDFETAKTHFALGQMDSGVSYTLRTFLFDDTKLYLGLNKYNQASLTKLENYFKGLREGTYRGGTTGLKGSRTTQNEDRPCRILSVRLSNGKQTGWEGFGNLLHKTSKLWDGDANPKPGKSVFNEIEGETIRKVISANGFQIPEGEFSNRDLGRLFDFEYSSGNYLRIGFSNQLASQIIECEHGDGNYGWSLFTDPLKIQALRDLLDGEEVDFSTRTGDPPCPGDPVPNPEITSSGPSGKRGGTYGCTRIEKHKICDGIPDRKRHKGIDITAPKGIAVYATHSGKVIDIRNTFKPGEYKEYSFGNYVTIKVNINGNTRYIKYNHLDEVHVQIGNSIAVGDIIGLAGNTGNAAKNEVIPHIDVQLFDTNWKPLDPIDLFFTKFDNQLNPILQNCN
jgi:murein DD-endopeptidase MepM/ murein hydrolase activator NlpD